MENSTTKNDEALNKIREVIEQNHRSDNGTSLEDEMNHKMAIFEMVLRGIDDSVYNGPPLTAEDSHGILLSWLEVKELIEQREKEHSKIYNLSSYGEKKR